MKNSELLKMMLESPDIVAAIDMAPTVKDAGRAISGFMNMLSDISDSIYCKGYDAGHEEGLKEGYDDGYDSGREDGYDDGYSDGLSTRDY